jgi:hypothetical protein
LSGFFKIQLNLSWSCIVAKRLARSGGEGRLDLLHRVHDLLHRESALSHRSAPLSKTSEVRLGSGEDVDFRRPPIHLVLVPVLPGAEPARNENEMTAIEVLDDHLGLAAPGDDAVPFGPLLPFTLIVVPNLIGGDGEGRDAGSGGECKELGFYAEPADQFDAVVGWHAKSLGWCRKKSELVDVAGVDGEVAATARSSRRKTR